MKLLFVTYSEMPYHTSSGSSVLMEALIDILIDLGFDITLLPLWLRPKYANDFNKYEKSLEEKGVKVIYNTDWSKPKKPHISFLLKLKKAILPLRGDYITLSSQESKSIQDLIDKDGYSVVLGYSPVPILTIENFRDVYKVASLVDLPNHSQKRRYLLANQVKGLRKILFYISWLGNRKLSDHTFSALGNMDLIIEHAFQHAEELKEKGLKNVHYIPHPLPIKKDFAYKKVKSEDKVVILIAGSLKGIASRLGFEFFLDDLLPEIKKNQARLTYEVVFRVVGHGQMVEILKKRLIEEPLVQFVGFVDDIETEYLNADILLVNIPVSHGFRTRIAEAMSYGLSVIAHSANSKGMPELQDEKNVMLGSDAKTICEKLISLINNPSLRLKLAEQGKLNFETHISKDAAKNKFKTIFEPLIYKNL